VAAGAGGPWERINLPPHRWKVELLSCRFSLYLPSRPGLKPSTVRRKNNADKGNDAEDEHPKPARERHRDED